MTRNVYVYIFLMAFTIFFIRALPLTLIRKPIKNRFIKSFLYYVPYVTLAVMTFPAIIYATGNIVVGLIGLIIGLICAYKEMDMFVVTIIMCLTVAIMNIFI